jgi:myosin heavy subunit
MHSSNPSVGQFMTILGKSNIGNPLLVIDNKAKHKFTIRHYAYDVTYNVENIIDMNQGLREINFATLSTSNSGREFRYSTDNTGSGSRRLSSGSNAHSPIRSNGKRRLSSRHQPDQVAGSPGSIGSKTPPRNDKNKYKKVKTSVHKKQPIAQTFMTEINELLSQIQTTRSHFVQCIKCNYDYNPDAYESGLVAQQLRYSACMESIKAIQNDLSLSMTYSSFISEFSCLLYMAGKCPMTKGVYNGLKALKGNPRNKRNLRLTVMSMVEIIPTIGAILAEIENNPFFIRSDKHCYDGIEFKDTLLKFSVEYLEYVESLKRSTIHTIATRLQRIWKAHRLMQFKRYAQARGQHALVYIANLKYTNSKRHHTNAVTIQRQVQVFLVTAWKKTKIGRQCSTGRAECGSRQNSGVR